MSNQHPNFFVDESSGTYRYRPHASSESRTLPLPRQDTSMIELPLEDFSTFSLSRTSSLSTFGFYPPEAERPRYGWMGPVADVAMHPYPDAVGRPDRCLGHNVLYTAHGHRYLSPGNSSSSQISNGWSDRQPTPSMDSDLGSQYSPEILPGEISYGFEGLHDRSPPMHHTRGVSMHDVQQYEDPQPEPEVYEEEHHVFYHQPQEGYATQETYLPVEGAILTHEPPQNTHPDHQYAASAPASITTSSQPNIKRRRTQPSPPSPTKANVKQPKRPIPRRIHSHPTRPTPTSHKSNSDTARAFTCALAPYGCTSTFTSKNEWKRHASTQHLRLGFWRCEYCASRADNSKSNDFNRKDLFVQHLRRMHADTLPRGSAAASASTSAKGKKVGGAGIGGAGGDVQAALEGAAGRCFRATRKAPEKSGCLFCGKGFEGEGSWDARMEHVGSHMDEAKKAGKVVSDYGEWRRDAELEEWLVKEGIVAATKNGLKVVEKP